MNWSDVFTYLQDRGEVAWNESRKGRGCFAGNIAGSVKSDGRYKSVYVLGKRRYLHRIIWELHFGEIPSGMCIDHIDGDGLNNRIENLRLTTLSENQKNSKIPSNSRTGIHGVYQRKHGFVVQMGAKHVGSYKDFFEACCIRKSLERTNGFHINHGRRM